MLKIVCTSQSQHGSLRRIFARTMSTIKHFDAVVIGSGQAGTPLATALAKAGKKTALIEREHLGGCCVNEGCTPAKTMIASGRIAYLASRAGDYGIRPKGVGEGSKGIPTVTDMQKVRQRKRDIVNQFRGGSERRLTTVEGLEVIMGEARFQSPKSLTVKLNSGKQNLQVDADVFFINTGERPAKPHLDGLERVPHDRVLDSTSIQELGEVPEKLIVLGGGYIGLEFGQLFRRLGSEVTIVQRAKQLAPREDAEVADMVKQILTDEGVEVLLGATATKIEFNDAKKLLLHYHNADQSSATVVGSHILFAAGRTPNSDMLNLEAAGVGVDAGGHIMVNEVLQTSAENIFALGDVHGGPAFTHISYDDMRVIRSNFIQHVSPPATITDRVVPYVVYMDPQLGHVGLHEAEARTKYPDRIIKTATMPMSYVARALETDETRGMMKAVVDGETGEILGFTCLGIEGGEVMTVVQIVMMSKLPYTKLQDAIFAHPTLAESLNNLWGFLK